MEYNRKQKIKKTYIFIISIIIHIIILLLLFAFYDYSRKDPILFKKKKTPAKILFQKPKRKPKPKPKRKPPKPKPRPKPVMPAFQGLQGSPKPMPKKKSTPKPTPKIKPKQKKQKAKRSLIKPAKKTTKKFIKSIDVNEIKKQEPEPVKLAKTTNKLTLKDLSKGFLDYTQRQGANLIQYTASAKGRPTEDQLKHERYIKKIFDCIETSLSIKRNTLLIRNNISPSEILMVIINIVLDTTGKIANISIASSSGITEFDYFMLRLIHDSSSSFPPVPSYLSKDTYFMPVKFHIPAGMVMLTRSRY